MRSPKNKRSNAVRAIVLILVYNMLFSPVWSGLGLTPVLMAAPDNQNLVQQGIDLYEQNKFEKAIETLQSAEIVCPDNIAIPYYLGLIYLKQEKRADAVSQWRRYVSMAPQDENTLTIRKNITLLLRREAKEYARKAVAEEAAVLQGPVDDSTVAITAFKNLGSQDLDPLGKGMAAMIIVDLSTFKDLKVVEREKLQALLAEMKLGTSGIVDENSAPKVGNLLRAKYITSGSLTDPEKNHLQIAAILQDAVLNATMGSQESSGRLVKFYDLEKEIACEIVTQLGRDCREAPEAFSKIHTKSLPALEAYSQGLDYFDEDKFDEARIMFQNALEKDPKFDLAQAALLATPVSAMLLLSESQMISDASSAAPSATATSSGTVAAAGATAAGGGVSLGTAAAITGGAVLVGGAVVGVAALLKEEDGDTPNSPSINTSPGGTWNGSWSDAAGNSGGLRLILDDVSTSSVTGRLELDGSECMSTGDVDGGLDGSHAAMSVTSGDNIGTLSADFDFASSTLEGTLRWISGTCEGTEYSVSGSRGTGDADVNW